MYKVTKQFLGIKKSVFVIDIDNSECLFTTHSVVQQKVHESL